MDLIIAAPGSSNPLYIRLLLEQTNTTERFRSSNQSLRGYTVASWIAKATKVDSPIGLYILILREWNRYIIEEEGLLASRNNSISIQRKSTSLMDRIASPKVNPAVPLKRMDKSNTQERALGGSENPILERNGRRTEVILAHRQYLDDNLSTKQHVLVIRHLLSLLVVSRYGLREEDLMQLVSRDISPSVFKNIFSLIKPHLLQIKTDSWMAGEKPQKMYCYNFNHNTFRLLVRFGFLQDSKLHLSYFRELAQYFEKADASQLRILELPIQLERCELWPTLTSLLSDIDLFQLWWTAYNREEYFAHWTILRKNHPVADPVDEFVKSLDRYIHRDRPNSKTLLALLLNLTEFLREYQARFDLYIVQNVSNHRPRAPQWKDFISSLAAQTSSKKPFCANFYTSQLDEGFATASLQESDSYYLQRWLWVQFPLFAIAFAHHFSDCIDTTRDKSLQSHPLNASVSKLSTKGEEGDVRQSSARHKEIASLIPQKRTKKTASDIPDVLEKPSLEDNNDTDVSDRFIYQDALHCSPDDLEHWSNQLLEIRTKYNQSIFLEKEKLALLKSLDAQLMDSRATTGHVGHERDKEEELQQRIVSAGKETVLGRQLSDYYKAVVRHCEANPARNSNILERCDVDIVKCKHEIAGVREKVHAVNQEKNLLLSKIDSVEQALMEKVRVHRAIIKRKRWQNHRQQRLAVERYSSKSTTEKLKKVHSPSIPKKYSTEHHPGVQADSQNSYLSDSGQEKSPAYPDAERELVDLLRHAGLNDSNEVHVLWKDLHQHELQLQEEESKTEECLLHSRQHLERLKLDLARVKLENNDTDNPPFSTVKNDVIELPHVDENLNFSRAELEQTSTTQTEAAYLQNLKLAESEVMNAISVTQRKRENALHLRNLLQVIRLFYIDTTDLMMPHLLET